MDQWISVICAAVKVDVMTVENIAKAGRRYMMRRRGISSPPITTGVTGGLESEGFKLDVWRQV